METQSATTTKGSEMLGDYLRRLRNGYGYSLRRVEELARAEGAEIDNSQLCRYENGVCYPSIEKLRALASVFNVSVQSFVEVIDLEVLEEDLPEGDTDELRVLRADFLVRLGKLSLAEQDLRSVLRNADRLDAEVRTRALLALANVHADQGDLFFSEIEAERARVLAEDEGLVRYHAMALRTLARVLADRCELRPAVTRFHESLRLFAGRSYLVDATHVRINIAACYFGIGRIAAGMRMASTALNDARRAGHRRLQAYAWSSLGRAHHQQGEMARARACFRESDALASHESDMQPDLLFLNAYYEWRMAMESRNSTRERIAVGRLKALRSDFERRFLEVDAFDDYLETGRTFSRKICPAGVLAAR